MIGVFFFVATFSALAVSTPYTITTDSGGTISFPYNIKFSESELKLLKSLDNKTLEKLEKTAQQVQERNIQAASSNPSQSYSIDSSGQPTTSETQSSQNPYYNPRTGKYQNTPVNPFMDSSSSGSSGGSQGGGQSGFGSGQTQSGGGSQTQTGGGSSQNGNQNSGGDQSSGSQSLGGGSVDMSSLTIDSMCGAPQYGVNLGGSCPNMQNATEKLKKTAALACSAIHKKFTSVSVFRRPGCAGKNGGQHAVGAAIDISHRDLSSADKQKVFEVFKKSGFEGYGCYGPNNHVHLDHGPARRWGPSGSGSSWDPNKCPQELFLAGYKR